MRVAPSQFASPQAHLAFQELHEVVKIDRVQRFLPDLSKKDQEHDDGGHEGVPLGADGRPLPRVNALQQVRASAPHDSFPATLLGSGTLHRRWIG